MGDILWLWLRISNFKNFVQIYRKLFPNLNVGYYLISISLLLVIISSPILFAKKNIGLYTVN